MIFIGYTIMQGSWTFVNHGAFGAALKQAMEAKMVSFSFTTQCRQINKYQQQIHRYQTIHTYGIVSYRQHDLGCT